MPSKSKKRKQTGRTNKKNTDQSFVVDEIIIWSSLAVSIFLLISNFGIGGFIGEILSAFLMDIFGGGAYLVPFLLFGLTAFTIINKGSFAAILKAVSVLFLFLLICTLMQLINDFGGIAGGFLESLLVPAIGVAGTYIAVLILMIICMVIITGKSALRGVRSKSEKAYDHARKDVERRKELADEKRKIRENQKKTLFNR